MADPSTPASRADRLGRDLAVVLRRLALDSRFADEVRSDPTRALAGYDLRGDDLAALALWLERPAPSVTGLDSCFENEPSTSTGGLA